jgi:hypothetical protein
MRHSYDRGKPSLLHPCACPDCAQGFNGVRGDLNSRDGFVTGHELRPARHLRFSLPTSGRFTHGNSEKIERITCQHLCQSLLRQPESP